MKAAIKCVHEYMHIAMREEPGMMTAEKIDEEGIRSRIADPFFNRTASILASVLLNPCRK